MRSHGLGLLVMLLSLLAPHASTSATPPEGDGKKGKNGDLIFHIPAGEDGGPFEPSRFTPPPPKDQRIADEVSTLALRPGTKVVLAADLEFAIEPDNSVSLVARAHDSGSSWHEIDECRLFFAMNPPPRYGGRPIVPARTEFRITQIDGSSPLWPTRLLLEQVDGGFPRLVTVYCRTAFRLSDQADREYPPRTGDLKAWFTFLEPR